MRPAVVITVYRRYGELVGNLSAARENFHEFPEPPRVIVVWAQPEIGRLWLFQQLLRDGLIDEVVSRPRLEGEEPHRPTTYPESHNIRLGLEAAFRAGATFAIVQAADIKPKPGVYKVVSEHMADGTAVALHWPNGCTREGIWHTNFLAVGPDREFWPPVSGPEHPDVLERQWGLVLAGKGHAGVLQTHNSRERYFTHAHESETLAPFPVFPQEHFGGIPLFVTGRKSWWRRLLDRFRCKSPKE